MNHYVSSSPVLFFFPNSLAIDLFWWVFSLILFQKKGIHIELAEMLANVELVFT